MALSLSDIEKKSPRRTKNKKTAHQRPWDEVEIKDDEVKFDLQQLSSAVEKALHALQKKSYWLSRWTSKNSWLGRVKTSPKLRIPLPSFFTRKT